MSEGSVPRALRLPARWELAGPAGASAVRAALDAVVAALDPRTQVRHVPVPTRVTSVGGAAVGRLVDDAAGGARQRDTHLYPGPSGLGLPVAAPPDWPSVVGEAADCVRLADGGLGRVLAWGRWPASVAVDLLGEVADAAAPAAVVLHLHRLEPAPAARRLRRRLAASSSSRLLATESGQLLDPAVAQAEDAAEQLWAAVVRGVTTVAAVRVLLALRAEDRAGLDAAEATARAEVDARGGTLLRLRYEQAPAWAACSPGAVDGPGPLRLLDAASVAAVLPHPRRAHSAARGVLVGTDPATGAPVLADRFAQPNPARLVVGTSGAGKSYAVALEVLRWHVAGVAAVVVDPEGEFGPLAVALRGQHLRVGEDAGLDPVGVACHPGLGAGDGLGLLATWATALGGRVLSASDLALLDRALGVLRADTPTGSGPTAADLVGLLTDLAAHPPFAGTDLPVRLAAATGGSLAAVFGPSPALADPSDDLVVVDLRAVPGRARAAAMACVLGWVWARATATAASGGRQLLLAVDEAHLLLDDPAAADLLAQFARRARKYGVGLEVATQRLSDLADHPAGRAVLATTATTLLLGCAELERAACMAAFGLSDAEGALLRPGTPGRGLLLDPAGHQPVQVVAAPPEHTLASAGPRRGSAAATVTGGGRQ